MQPHCSYFVCATPRSGSTLLCEALTNTGLAGWPKEYFEALRDTGLPRRPREYFLDLEIAEIDTLLGGHSWIDDLQPVPAGKTSYAEYLAQVIEEGTTPNGVFGAKVMWGYLDDFVCYLRTIPQYQMLGVPELLAAIFPNLSYIFVTRRDKVAQAVSLWKAIQTQAWRREDDENHTNNGQHHKALAFHFEAIDHLKRRIEDHETAWRWYFAEIGVEPFTVVYEDLAEAYEETALKILQFLHIPVPAEKPSFAQRRMRQQADALSRQWVQQYHTVRRERELREEQPSDA